MILTLKNYQRGAVDKIKNRLELFFKESSRGNIVFKSPTGSGKTFVMSSVIEEFTEEHKEMNFCFIWASPGKGDLHIQSYESVRKYLGGNPPCSILELDFLGNRKEIRNKEVVFLNWEKLVQKDKETGGWANNLMKDQEGFNFIDILQHTRNNGTEIILVIDESHIGSSQKTRIREFVETILKPNTVIEMSATPLSDHVDVEIDASDVVAEGMIKESVIVNEGISKDDQSISESDSELLILTKGFEKREEIVNKYAKLGIHVNPLVLIQIPNVDEGEAKKTVCRDFLRDHGITEDNGKLKLWCDNEGEFDKKLVKNNDDITQYLIFKTAVATGWDCPRAHILIKFRDGKSETFEIQTIGRILRTAEAKSYEDPLLDNAYIYTNIKNFETKKDTYSPNRIKTEFSSIREPYTQAIIREQTLLESYYRSRQGDYNSADSRYTKYLQDEFMKFFDLSDEDKLALAGSLKDRLTSKGLNLDLSIDDELIVETMISHKQFDDGLKTDSSLASVKMSENDMMFGFYSIIRENLNGLAYVRSKSPITSAIIELFSTFYNIYPRDTKIKSIQRVVVQNSEIFAKIINDSTLKFRQMLMENSGKTGEFYDFHIESIRAYSLETHTKMTAPKSLYQPLFVLKADDDEPKNKLEKAFLNHLGNSNSVEWFWENGAEHMRTNFGIPYNNGLNTFQPDFIVKYTNGTVGIYDTKPEGYREEDTSLKSNALFEYLKKINDSRESPRVIGGIVIQDGGQFYCYSDANYEDFKKNREKWVLFDTILKDNLGN